jgi:hypothetical protein
MHTRKHITDCTLTIVFVLLIFIPCIGTVFHWDFYPLQGENRPLAERPVWGTVPVAQYPEKFEAWFCDHFGFRNTFIRRYNRTIRELFKIQSPQVIFGQDDWLFYNKDSIMKDFLGYHKLSDKDLLIWKDKLLTRKNKLAGKGITYRFVVVPNKCNVYTKKMPEALQRSEAEIKRIEQLQACLKDTEAPQPLYLQDALKEASKTEQVYFKNDCHWNEAGSYAGYKEIINSLTNEYPGITPLPLELFPREIKPHYGDLSDKLLGLGKSSGVPRNHVLPLNNRIEIEEEIIEAPEQWGHCPVGKVIISNNPDKKLTLLVFHDSFAYYGWMPLMQATFGKTIFIQSRPNEFGIDYAIERYKPDIVVEEWMERFLQQPNE